ncbi:hypothetical protein ACI2OX_15020 [Bacillus sp. N9]
MITYALVGLLLLLFMKISGRALLWIGFLLYFLPQLFIGALFIAYSYVGDGTLADFTDVAGLQRSADTYATGSF